MDLKSENFEEKKFIQIEYNPISGLLLLDIIVFTKLITACLEATDRQIKKAQIQKLLGSKEWIEHYNNKSSGKRVLSESPHLEHKHELHTAKWLTHVNYDVIFAPKGMFKRSEKKFDVFLIKEHIILKADLKKVSSKNPDTIANRIKEGSDQASRVVLDVVSDITKKALIRGLRSGSYKNKLLKEVLLFYKGCFYILPKNLIESKRIYEILQ